MENQSEVQKTDRAKKMLVWLGVAGIAMFFAAFTSAYIVLQADHFWVQDKLPFMFTISTVVILVSSLTIYMAQKSIKKGDVKALKLWMSLTFLLGIGFTATQYYGWAELREAGKFFVGDISAIKGEYGKDYVVLMKGEPLLNDNGNFYKPTDIGYSSPLNDRVNDTFNISASFLYILSGLHVAHLLGGLLWLIALLLNTYKGKYTVQNHLGIDLGSIYWHFLDVLWVYLFFFLLLIR
ncbi:heme-copper oxidase subunit III [Bacteroidota bacterium]